MMYELIKQLAPVADDIRFAFSFGVLGLALCCVLCAIGTAWEWKDDRPKDSKFWCILGILFHLLATLNARVLFLLQDAGAILERTEHFLTALNMGLTFIAMSFYFRFLTYHWKPFLWRKVVIVFLGVILLAFWYRMAT